MDNGKGACRGVEFALSAAASARLGLGRRILIGARRRKHGPLEQHERERRAFALAGLEVHVTTEVVGDMAHDRETESRAWHVGAAAVNTVEALEDPLVIADRNSGTLDHAPRCSRGHRLPWR